MNDRSSLTAEYMALFRAMESSLPDEERLFCDPYAPLFLRRWRRWACAAARFEAGRRIVEGLLDRSAPGARAAGIARTKWFDDGISRAIETCRQLVLLGAGFDTRAYRLPAAQGVDTFELDAPPMSAAKQAALQTRIGALPERVHFVAIDFNSEPAADALRRAGFNPSRSTCFVWEGVTNYLAPAAVDTVLREVAQAAGGSLLLFTYVDRRVLEKPELFFGAERLLARLRSYGEPWTFGLYPEELDQYLAARGLRLLEDLSVSDVWRAAARRGPGTRGYEFYRLARACVPG